MQLAAVKERELREKMTAADAKVELAKLAANPLFTPDWQVNVNVAMSKLTNDFHVGLGRYASPNQVGGQSGNVGEEDANRRRDSARVTHASR